MKIAFIGQKGIPAKLGGVEKYTEEVASRMAKLGHEVFVYARNNYTDKSIREYKGTKLIHLPSISSKNLDAISHTFFATVHAIFQNYDIIHYHSIGPTSLSFLIRIFCPRTVVISTFQCQDYMHKKWGAFARLYLRVSEYITCKVPHRTIVISKILARYAMEKYKAKTILIPNGAEIRNVPSSVYLKKWNLQRGSYIVYIGRLIRHKGVHYLINAFKSLEDQHLTRGKKLVIVGDGFHTDDYVKELKDASRGRSNIIFTGSLSGEALDEVFSHAYLFVQPSESEGLSLALLEAMGHGKAILSSDIQENMEPLNEEVALFFRSGNELDLEHKLVALINDPLWVKEMGENGKIKARREFSWDTIVRQIEQVYEDVLKQKKIKLFSKTNAKNIAA